MLKWMKLISRCLPELFACSNKAKKYIKYDDVSLTERHDFFASEIEKANKKGLHFVPIIKGEENIPDGQVLFASNHCSCIDALFLMCVIKRPIFFLVKKEAKKFPFIGKIIESSKGVFIDRQNLRSEIKSINDAVKTLEKYKEVSYFVCPEGTRSVGPDFVTGDFHAGTFKVATKANVPIVPISMYLTERILDNHYHYKKYPVQITFNKPIMPDQYETLDTHDISDIAKEEIVSELENLKNNDRELVKKMNHYSDKKVDKVRIILKANKKN